MSTSFRPNSVVVSHQSVRTAENGNTAVDAPTVNEIRWTDNVTYGANVPQWRSNLRRGLPATTSMVGYRVDARFTSGQVVATLPKNGNPNHIYKEKVTGLLSTAIGVPASNPNGISVAEATNQALGRFHQRIYDVNHQIMGGVVLGELRETLQTIRNPARGLRRLVDDFRSKAMKIRGSRVYPLPYRIRSVTENLADLWLEAQFGWRPLMSDISDGAKALGRYKSGQALQTRRLTASARVDGPVTRTQTTRSGSLVGWICTESSSYYSQVIFRGAMRVEARNPLQFDPALLGFDLASWAPTAWELIPYSFLIDYFTNIGDIIVGWSNIGTRLAWCNSTTRRAYTVSTVSEAHPFWSNPAYESVTHLPGRWSCESRLVSRSAHSGPPAPGIDFEIPGLGSLKWLNIAALVANRRSDRSWFYD